MKLVTLPSRGRSPKIDLKHIKIASPCPADWNRMAGDDRVRHCAECDLNVYNFSAMTEREIHALLAGSKRRVCGRFYRRADGTMLTQDCPRGLRALGRRVSRLAVAIATAVMTVGMNVTLAKSQTLQGAVAPTQSNHEETGMAVLVTDPQGAAVAGAKVTVTSKDSKKIYTGTTDSNGVWRLVGLTAGEYEFSVEAAVFITDGRLVIVRQGKVTEAPLSLRIGGLTGIVEVGVISENSIQVETQDSSLGLTLSGDQITNTPQR